jgi:hypothetical protein
MIKIVKYLFFGLFSLGALCSLGLILYYHSIYKPTPWPTKASAAVALTQVQSSSGRPVILPVPRKLEWGDGRFNLKVPVVFNAPAEDAEEIAKIIQTQFQTTGIRNNSGSVKFIKNNILQSQGYRLSVKPNQLIVEYNDFPGLFYALTTLKQLAKQSNNQLPCAQIEDYPDLKVRGAMLDISRGKVPTLQTLFGMVDFMADLKYNQLQLYIEGFSFGYPSFKNLWEKSETPLMPDEIKQLDEYCKDRCIELVPNQNMLGHMDAWLKTKEFKDLAECPEGYKLLGLIEMKTTLAPANPGSLELVKKMSEDLLPNFQSNQFNVNLDEPFELGKSKKNPVTDKLEIARIYLNYVKKLNDFANSKGKEIMMWGDVISRSPEIIPEIPRNITLLEWRYESVQPFKTICAQYQKAGLHYMVCPGTSSWSSFTGRTDNMMGNIEDAATNAIKYGADGMLITDWGDTPHLQYLTASYAGLAYAAALSWNYLPRDQVPLGCYLSQAVFKDSSGKMGDLVLDLGRYNQFEEYPMVAMTTTSLSYRFGIMDKAILEAINGKLQSGLFELLPGEPEVKKEISSRFSNPKIYNSKAIVSYVDSLEKVLGQTKLNVPDCELIKREYLNSVRMIRLGAKLKHYNNYHLQQTDFENRQLLSEMKTLCQSITKEHDYLWMGRNKQSGLEFSKENFKNLHLQIDESLAMMDKDGLTRWVKKLLNELKTSAAVLYLK